MMSPQCLLESLKAVSTARKKVAIDGTKRLLQYNRRDFEEPNGTKMSGDQVEADELKYASNGRDCPNSDIIRPLGSALTLVIEPDCWVGKLAIAVVLKAAGRRLPAPAWLPQVEAAISALALSS